MHSHERLSQWAEKPWFEFSITYKLLYQIWSELEKFSNHYRVTCIHTDTKIFASLLVLYKTFASWTSLQDYYSEHTIYVYKHQNYSCLNSCSHCWITENLPIRVKVGCLLLSSDVELPSISLCMHTGTKFFVSFNNRPHCKVTALHSLYMHGDTRIFSGLNSDPHCKITAMHSYVRLPQSTQKSCCEFFRTHK